MKHKQYFSVNQRLVYRTICLACTLTVSHFLIATSNVLTQFTEVVLANGF